MLQPGDKAPDFDLPTDTGRVSLSGLKGKNIVLYFYPKDDTAGCTSEALQFSSEVEEFQKLGAVIVGVSKDSVASHAKFRAKHDLTIELAADPLGDVVEAYGAWVEKSMYGRKYMGVDRSTFLIDREGVIREVWRKVKVPGHIKAVMNAAKAIKQFSRAGKRTTSTMCCIGASTCVHFA